MHSMLEVGPDMTLMAADVPSGMELSPNGTLTLSGDDDARLRGWWDALSLTWPREIPIDGEPADVAEIVRGNAAWMAASPVPKRFVNGEPGALLTASGAGAGPTSRRCRCRACTSCRRIPDDRRRLARLAG